jgi:quinol monooxygenase YgiN
LNISYGFQATMTAHPGKSEELVELLLSGPTVGPAAHEGCVVILVSRSTSNPDVDHLTEGRVSYEVHETVFNAPESQDYIAKSAELVADAQYTDYVPLGGKAALGSTVMPQAT